MSAIDEKHKELEEAGLELGEPTSEEMFTADGIGSYKHFEYGSIYWTEETGAHEVHGLIREKWEQLGWELSPLGYPVSDELDTHNGTGRYSDFQRGSIFWTAERGAYELYGSDAQQEKDAFARVGQAADQLLNAFAEGTLSRDELLETIGVGAASSDILIEGLSNRTP